MEGLVGEDNLNEYYCIICGKFPGVNNISFC